MEDNQEKKVYTTPALIVYGDVETITQLECVGSGDGQVGPCSALF
jgi:hypothetical protein